MNPIKRIGFKFAFQGLKTAFGSEYNLRLHLISSLITIGFGHYLNISPIEWCLIAICIGGVFVTELINTAIEYLVDMVQPEHHPIAGKVKDIAAGAVLFAGFTAFVCGSIIFGIRIFELF